mmetsp:Transcript_14785/g.40906  ORF Transcript_14785/g.40906 Transcript_14785/m.40906 type:complete len:202 (-) Transcript_14785:158-763(-)
MHIHYCNSARNTNNRTSTAASRSPRSFLLDIRPILLLVSLHALVHFLLQVRIVQILQFLILLHVPRCHHFRILHGRSQIVRIQPFLQRHAIARRPCFRFLHGILHSAVSHGIECHRPKHPECPDRRKGRHLQSPRGRGKTQGTTSIRCRRCCHVGLILHHHGFHAFRLPRAKVRAQAERDGADEEDRAWVFVECWFFRCGR